MEINEQISNSIFFIIKIGLIVLMIVYSAFAAIILRQTNIMAETLEVDIDNLIVAVARLHLFVAIVILGATVILL